jgi:predicted acyltransferase
LAWFWNLVFPINKKIWTSSYVMLTVGIDIVLLVFSDLYHRVQGKVKWTAFFAVFGKNPLFVYIVSELLIVILFIIPVGGTEIWRNGPPRV